MVRKYTEVENVEVVLKCIDHLESMYFENVNSAELNSEDHYLILSLSDGLIRYFDLNDTIKLNIQRRRSK